MAFHIPKRGSSNSSSESAVTESMIARVNNNLDALHKALYEKAINIAKLAPRDLREFMHPELVRHGCLDSFFDERSALRTFTLRELGPWERSRFLDSMDYAIGKAALEFMAAPNFVIDEAWENSIHREVLAEHLPCTLERLESQAEEAYFHRQLASI